MKPISASLDIRLAPERLFAWLSARWEDGNPLGGDERAPAAGSAARMGDGFRVPCPAGPWALPGEAELVIRDYRPVEGWCAESPDARVLWETRIAPAAPAAARLTCRLRYDAPGVEGRFRDLLWGRMRRRRTVRRLLRRWKDDAERREALQRLRGGGAARGPPPEQAPRSTGGVPDPLVCNSEGRAPDPDPS